MVFKVALLSDLSLPYKILNKKKTTIAFPPVILTFTQLLPERLDDPGFRTTFLQLANLINRFLDFYLININRNLV